MCTTTTTAFEITNQNAKATAAESTRCYSYDSSGGPIIELATDRRRYAVIPQCYTAGEYRVSFLLGAGKSSTSGGERSRDDRGQ